MREDTVAEHFRLSDKLKVNQRIEFKIYSGKYEGNYQTQIADVKDEKKFIINAPFSKGQPLTVPINTRAEVKLREEEGIYVLPVKIVGRDVDVTPLLILRLRGAVKRIQERQFFRLELHQRTNYRILANNNEEFEAMLGVSNEVGGEEVTIETDKKLPKLNTPGIVKDVSAGGIKLSTEEKLEADQIVEIDFDFMNASFSTLFGEVIRVEEKIKDEVKRYEAGVEFINCRQKYRDEITRWLFAKQRELRKKGLI